MKNKVEVKKTTPKYETFKKKIVKVAISEILKQRGRKTSLDMKVNGGEVDILDMDNMIAYCVENNFTMRKLRKRLSSLSGLRDVFFIDILEVPDDIFEIEAYIREKVV